MNSWVKCFASFFYIGTLPKAPGTFGSLAGLGIAWFFNQHLWVFLAALSLVGFAIAPAAQKAFGQEDPQAFVLDEAVGMMLAVLWIPKSFIFFVVGFVLFRIFDIWKPWPIILIQKSKKASAIIWDDLAAGFLVNLILQIALKFRA